MFHCALGSSKPALLQTARDLENKDIHRLRTLLFKSKIRFEYLIAFVNLYQLFHFLFLP